MDRPYLKAIVEHTMLLAALATGGLMTILVPSDKQSAVASRTEDTTTNVATENLLLDTIGFDVDARHLDHIAAMC